MPACRRQNFEPKVQLVTAWTSLCKDEVLQTPLEYSATLQLKHCQGPLNLFAYRSICDSAYKAPAAAFMLKRALINTS